MAKAYSAILMGLDAEPIEIEAELLSGLHAFSIVGLADKSVSEAKERVSLAIRNAGMKPPTQFNRKIVINLAPADLRKEGTAYDVAIAIAFLAATEQIQLDRTQRMFLGELALDGRVRPISGALSMALAAKQRGFSELYLPRENVREVAFMRDMTVYPVERLSQVLEHLRGVSPLSAHAPQQFAAQQSGAQDALRYIRGHALAKRVLTIAAAGGHNVLLYGPPGTGKTILAQSLALLLPPLTLEESVEVTRVYSALGLAAELMTVPQMRAPHHSASDVAILGGGADPRPGEVSLAHRGVLFLDEFPEFPRAVLEGLREPLESGTITVARAKRSFTFPARFIFVAAMNPCPCGYYGDPEKECRCTVAEIRRYRKKLSGPLLDRIDLFLEVKRIAPEVLLATGNDEAVPRDPIRRARERQKERGKLNAELSLREVGPHCALVPAAEKVITAAAHKFALSPRAVHRLMKVARTIADLGASAPVTDAHILEALQYRQFDVMI